jgi:hypothetical protein
MLFSFQKAIVAKLQRILSRRRITAGQTQNTNGGRPIIKNRVSYLDPGVHSEERNNEVDGNKMKNQDFLINQY